MIISPFSHEDDDLDMVGYGRLFQPPTGIIHSIMMYYVYIYIRVYNIRVYNIRVYNIRVCIYIYPYMYIYSTHTHICIYIYTISIYTYIYIYIYTNSLCTLQFHMPHSWPRLGATERTRRRCRWPTGRFISRGGQVWPRGDWRSFSASLRGREGHGSTWD